MPRKIAIWLLQSGLLILIIHNLGYVIPLIVPLLKLELWRNSIKVAAPKLYFGMRGWFAASPLTE